MVRSDHNAFTASVFIIIPVFNRWTFTKKCLESLKNQSFKDFRIVVVDHGSTDDTQTGLASLFPEVVVLKGNSSMWWTAATNLGINYALPLNPKFILTLNNDLIVKPDYLAGLLATASTYPNAIIGSVSVDIVDTEKVSFNGTIWNSWLAKFKSAIPLNTKYSTLNREHKIVNTDMLPGRGTLIPVSAFSSVGLFDEHVFPHYMADIDFTLRCKKAGYEIILSTDAVVLSHTNSTGLKTSHTKRTLKYWKDFLVSTRSPNNLKTRWQWAKRHGRIAIFYFLVDYSRILYSQVKTSFSHF